MKGKFHAIWRMIKLINFEIVIRFRHHWSCC
jgi:hypothetical protein